ncbi:CdaR family protein [Paenibacillus chitinolyticus]
MDRWLRNTNVVRVIAVIIGILLWAVVRMEGTTVTNSTTGGIKELPISNVQITPKYDSDKYYISSIEPSRVQVILKGKDSALKRVSTSEYKVVLDLTKAGGKGEYVLPLEAVGFPSSLQVDIVPRNVKVVVEEQEMKEVPVKINVKGTPQPGYKSGDPIAKPSKVHVTVPASKADEVATVQGEISVDKADSAVTKQVKLKVYNKEGRELPYDIRPAVVDVDVPVTSPFKTVPLQIQLTGNLPPGYSIGSVKQNPDKIMVYGAQNVLDGMDFYSGVTLKIDGLKETKEFTLDIPLQKGVTQIEPTKVQVTVEIVSSIKKEYPGIPLKIVGQAEGTEVKFTDPPNGSITLTLEGAAPQMEAVKPEDIQAIVDVSNLPPGTHELPITLNLPPYIKDGGTQVTKAKVVISAAQTQTESKNPSPTPIPTPTPIQKPDVEGETVPKKEAVTP